MACQCWANVIERGDRLAYRGGPESVLAERLVRLLRFLWGCLSTVGGAVGWCLATVGGQVARRWRLVSYERAARTAEWQRREVFENLGKMVFLLYKKNLVRNADLLAECEKVVAIDVRIDEVLALADRVRTDRPADAEPVPMVAATPVETDAADPATPAVPTSSAAPA